MHVNHSSRIVAFVSICIASYSQFGTLEVHKKRLTDLYSFFARLEGLSAISPTHEPPLSNVTASIYFTKNIGISEIYDII